jgi:hypothetical protein
MEATNERERRYFMPCSLTTWSGFPTKLFDFRGNTEPRQSAAVTGDALLEYAHEREVRHIDVRTDCLMSSTRQRVHLRCRSPAPNTSL